MSPTSCQLLYSAIFCFMVPVTGLEPVQHCCRGILSPLCLPIPPYRRTGLDNIPQQQRGVNTRREFFSFLGTDTTRPAAAEQAVRSPCAADGCIRRPEARRTVGADALKRRMRLPLLFYAAKSPFRRLRESPSKWAFSFTVVRLRRARSERSPQRRRGERRCG